MVTQQDYEDLARQVEYIFSLVTEVHGRASELHVPIPQSMARVWTEWGTSYPRQIREIGARRATEPLTEWLLSMGFEQQDDEPEEGS